MTNTQLLILLTILVLGYLYWKNHTQLAPKTKFEPEIIFETEDLTSDSDDEVTPQLPTEQKDWFAEKHWLSDKEIDWALEQIEQEWVKDNTFRIGETSISRVPFFKALESTQFMFTKEAMKTKDIDARFSFPVLLSELTGAEEELVFISVNNPDFHWSLLVYETKTKKFYHFDTLKGANDAYVKPLVKELLQQIKQTNQPNLKTDLETRYHLSQGNTWDCGIAVIEIAKTIIKDYPTFKKILLYTKLDFNFAQARQTWKNKLTHD